MTAETPPVVAGRWACVNVLEGNASIPVFGSIATRTDVLSRLDVAQDGVTLRVTWTVVAMRVDSGTRLSRPEISDSNVDALEVLERAGRLERDAAGHWHMVLPAASSVMGARLRANDEPLPTDADDARVIDEDADGKPGVTVRFRGWVSGRVYVVQRTTTELKSGPMAADAVSGRVSWTTDQSVLGASNPLLRLAPSVTPSDASWFRMRRVAADASDARVREVADALLAEGRPSDAG